MAEIVNFNKARKSKARADRKARATENRVKFGRTKADRDLEKARAEKAVRNIDAHRRAEQSDPTDDTPR